MRWPRPRFTVRRAMLAVLVIAAALGLGLPAAEVLRTPEMHAHAWINPGGVPRINAGGPIRPGAGAATVLQVEIRPSPFWPRYGAALLGRSWRNRPFCPPEPGRVAEACEYAHPEMAHRSTNGLRIDWPPEIRAEGNKRYPGLFPADRSQPSPLAGP